MIWYEKLDDTIFTWFKYSLTEKLGGKYPNLFVTNVASTDANTKFPSVYIRFLEPREIGQDLYNDTVAGLDVSYQIEVTDNVSQSRCKEVCYACIETLKELHFNITFPVYDRQDKLYKGYLRANRVVGNGDTDIIGS